MYFFEFRDICQRPQKATFLCKKTWFFNSLENSFFNAKREKLGKVKSDQFGSNFAGSNLTECRFPPHLTYIDYGQITEEIWSGKFELSDHLSDSLSVKMDSIGYVGIGQILQSIGTNCSLVNQFRGISALSTSFQVPKICYS